MNVLGKMLCIFSLTLLAVSTHASAEHPLARMAGNRAFRYACMPSSMPGSPSTWDASTIGKLYIDMGASYDIKSEDRLREKAYEVLDDIMRRESRLDNAWKPPSTDPNLQTAYYFLKYRMRFAEGLAKVAVAQEMAESGMKSYSIQAMESGIDCLQLSAQFRDRLEKVKPSSDLSAVDDLDAALIRSIRQRLLETWDTAKTTGTLDPIRTLDLRTTTRKGIDDAVTSPSKRDSALKTFDWLKE